MNRLVTGWTVLLLELGLPSVGYAQAWLPPKGEGSVSIIAQDMFVKDHYLPTARYDLGHIRAESLILDVTYGVTDTIAVSLSLPYVSSKYNGPLPHQLPVDNGNFHSTYQDFQFNVRYNVSRRGLVVTPFVGTIVPSHDYPYFAHAAAGRDLRELQVGTYFARLLDPVLPGAFVQGRYSYGFTERVLDVSHNRSNLDLEAGYFVTPSFRMFALGTGQVVHGGLDYYYGVPLPPEVFRHHDQIGRDNLLNVGGGAAFSLSRSVDLFGSLTKTVAGRNGHQLSHSLSIGVTYSFSRHSQARTIAERQEKSLVKCLCEKAQ